MHYVLLYDVADDYVTRRTPFRGEHLRLASEAHACGELVLGGALTDPADGAMLVFRGPTSETAEAFAKADPYVRNGVVKQWRVRKWNTVVGDGATVWSSPTAHAKPTNPLNRASRQADRNEATHDPQELGGSCDPQDASSEIQSSPSYQSVASRAPTGS